MLFPRAMDQNGFLWIPMDSYGYGFLYGSHGSKWIPMDSYGYGFLWNPMAMDSYGSHGSKWIPMDSYGYGFLWNPMDSYGFLWKGFIRGFHVIRILQSRGQLGFHKDFPLSLQLT
jgi:hypothetical protein